MATPDGTAYTALTAIDAVESLHWLGELRRVALRGARPISSAGLRGLAFQVPPGTVDAVLQREPGDSADGQPVLGGERFDSPDGGRLEPQRDRLPPVSRA